MTGSEAEFVSSHLEEQLIKLIGKDQFEKALNEANLTVSENIRERISAKLKDIVITVPTKVIPKLEKSQSLEKIHFSRSSSSNLFGKKSQSQFITLSETEEPKASKSKQEKTAPISEKNNNNNKVVKPYTPPPVVPTYSKKSMVRELELSLEAAVVLQKTLSEIPVNDSLTTTEVEPPSTSKVDQEFAKIEEELTKVEEELPKGESKLRESISTEFDDTELDPISPTKFVERHDIPPPPDSSDDEEPPPPPEDDDSEDDTAK